MFAVFSFHHFDLLHLNKKNPINPENYQPKLDKSLAFYLQQILGFCEGNSKLAFLWISSLWLTIFTVSWQWLICECSVYPINLSIWPDSPLDHRHPYLTCCVPSPTKYRNNISHPPQSLGVSEFKSYGYFRHTTIGAEPLTDIWRSSSLNGGD